MAIGLGVAFALCRLLTVTVEQKRWLRPALVLASVCGFGQVLWIWSKTELALPRQAAVLALLIVVGAGVLTLFGRFRFVRIALLGTACLMPVESFLSHWWANEQRGHLFGFWFGHDMFSPPFRNERGELAYERQERARALQGPQAKWTYPEMSRDAVLFGGTDPGRFCPTYMIFSESFLEPRLRRDPEFDRRDVYVITQNALADEHYLEYIRAHYQRSRQQDPLFFSELLRPREERMDNLHTNFLARLALPLDHALTQLGSSIECQRRAGGVYPSQELHLPTGADMQRYLSLYVQDWQERAKRGQLSPGETVEFNGQQARLNGTATVMAINAMLTRQIFDQNPERDFFVEESFPIDWMYPHLTPFGTILKLERQPPLELGPEIVARDRKFWRDYMSRLIGDWVKPETNVAEICTFAQKVHLRRDLDGYQGDRKFLRDEQAQKAFSKLRSAIAGVYDWRFRQATGQLQQLQQQLTRPNLARDAAQLLRVVQHRPTTEQRRMFQEAEFASKQAYALCPFSPEAFQRLVNLLLSAGRVGEALAVAETSQRLDPGNAFYTNVAGQLRRMPSQGS